MTDWIRLWSLLRPTDDPSESQRISTEPVNVPLKTQTSEVFQSVCVSCWPRWIQSSTSAESGLCVWVCPRCPWKPRISFLCGLWSQSGSKMLEEKLRDVSEAFCWTFCVQPHDPSVWCQENINEFSRTGPTYRAASAQSGGKPFNKQQQLLYTLKFIWICVKLKAQKLVCIQKNETVSRFCHLSTNL